jgi:glycosyltransferase involved in cell wall biosynthesis
VLDLTRLVSRAGRVLTGIDRVELAYLNWLILEPTECFGLVRTSLGYVLLDREGMAGFRDRVEGTIHWGRTDAWSLLSQRKPLFRRRAEADLRRLHLERCRPRMLAKMLRKHVPHGCVYLNVGHNNFTDRVIAAFKQGLQAQISVLLHDTIPLDLPKFQRPKTVDKFRSFLKRVSQSADLVICNSEVTEQDAIRFMEIWGRVPVTIVAHSGTIPTIPDLRELPVGLGIHEPFFLTIGTIEPRKNHAFLLDLWEKMEREHPAGKVPQLVICGSRGWNNEQVFQRLDKTPMRGKQIIEVPGLSDAAIAALMARTSGVLFPSFAEGYGLPAVEAVAAGAPLVCNDLPVFREILDDIPIYAPVSDSYLWSTTIMGLAKGNRAEKATGGGTDITYQVPSWAAHFNAVLKVS